MVGLVLGVAVSLGAAGQEQDEERTGFDHSAFAEVLDRYVEGSWVDYTGLKRDPGHLAAYLRDLAQADVDELDRKEKIALYINAYNAFTLKLITEYYPKIDSIKDIPDHIFRYKRWKDKRWDIGGETYSLSQIEHGVLRERFEEPLAHFALNCASIGCPDLWPEPYRGKDLEKQLEAAARAYNAADKGVRLDRADRTIYLSRIYDWYAGDFKKEADSVLQYVARYMPEEAARYIRRNEDRLRVRYLDYDWRLNDVKNNPDRESEGE